MAFTYEMAGMTFVHLRLWYGGKFLMKKKTLKYDGGQFFLYTDVDFSKVDMRYLRGIGGRYYKTVAFEIWYKLPRKSWDTGKTLIAQDRDIPQLINGKDDVGFINLHYVAVLDEEVQSPSLGDLNIQKKTIVRDHKKSNAPNSGKNDAAAAPSYEDINLIFNTPTHTYSIPKNKGTPTLPLRRSPRNLAKTTAQTQIQSELPNLNFTTHKQKLGCRRGRTLNFNEGKDAVGSKGLQIGKDSVRESVQKRSKNTVIQGIKGKEKATDLLVESDEDDSDYGDSEFTDSEDEGDELSSDDDCVFDSDGRVNEEIFVGEDTSHLLTVVDNSLDANRPDIWGVDDVEVIIGGEVADDSDESRSLRGSDDETDHYSTFNPQTDFTKPIVLKKGLKFPTNKVLRKALVCHSIENGYDFWYQHNSGKRLTAYCRYKCNCEWNKKRSRFGACHCESRVCNFMIHATSLKMEETFQIKSLELEHDCWMSQYNRKVSSEFLAEKFLNFWKNNMDWRLKKFRDHVLQTLNVYVSYSKCWLARSRARLLISGNGNEQYARIWDYAAAIKKHNPGSSAFVVCDNIERPPVTFRRVYICLDGCKSGFLSGCRPIIGVDGCHLKGAYPGMCLVAVGVDANNNIYPIAWAVVEVENAASWRWFLELLINDLNKAEGEGLTFMSDRQKGLVDALNLVAPKAEVRYCVRHIWANFKLTYSGQVYKDAFWSAARATTKVFWSAARDRSSNMIVNNICESFNAVLKDARDKPILTHMEWMRRYVMTQLCEKKEGVSKFKGRFMPYVKTELIKAKEDSKFFKVTQSSLNVYEVDQGLKDTWVVELEKKSCTCYQWDLSGLPCAHAIACILKQRLNAEDYVNEFYTTTRYVMTYEPVINAMPGINQWEKTGLPKPLPPPLRKMPGRPSLKRRRKEIGEGKKDSGRVKRARKPNTCGNCGTLGHNKRKCTNLPAPQSSQTKQVDPLELQIGLFKVGKGG